jgi:hypothetical protein
MWYGSSVFKCFPFSPIFIMSMVSVIFPYVCPVFSMWFECPGLLLLLLILCVCSLYLVLNVLLVCPTYFIWWIPLLLYSSICNFCLSIFCIVFFVRNATFTPVFRKRFVIPHLSHYMYSWPTFFWLCGSVCVLCFCLFCGGLTKFLLYSLFCNISLMMFSSRFFAFSVIGYVYNQFNKYVIPDNLCSCG